MFLFLFCFCLQIDITCLDGLSELRGDLVDGLVLGFRHFEPDVTDEEDLSRDEDGENVRSEQQL